MYRRCCNCGCNKNNWISDDMAVSPECEDCYEESCSDVENTLGIYDECNCGFDEFNEFPENPVLGQSYVPIQTMNKTFIPCVGLKMGTIFPELVSPYMPGQSMAENEYLRRRNIIGEGCNKC